MRLLIKFFFSLLFRRFSYNTTSFEYAPGASTCFSPLFIGASRSTNIDTALSRGELRFSPLFIGASRSTRYKRETKKRKQSFSPLFIGASRSTALPIQSHQILSRRFQSPLHWGIAFNGSPFSAYPGDSMFQSPLHLGIAFNASWLAVFSDIKIFLSPLPLCFSFVTIS